MCSTRCPAMCWWSNLRAPHHASPANRADCAWWCRSRCCPCRSDASQMNSTPQEQHAAGPAALLAAMVHTRLELAAIDLESHVAATAGALLIGVTAMVVALVAFAFAGVAVIAIFWETHRLAAA